MRRRGFSLVLVLLVSSVMLVIGLALGVMSSISLHRAQQLVASRQAELLARAVAAELEYELDQRVWTANTYGIVFPDMMYGADALRKRFETVPIFPDGGSMLLDEHTSVSVNFDSNKPYYSVDNLNGISTIPGWTDVGTGRASVPPFSVDLVVTTRCDDMVRHRDIVVSRIWPTAAYCIQSPVRIRDGCRVFGNVYDQGPSTVTVGESLPSTLDGDIWVPASRSNATIVLSQGSTLTGSVRFNQPASAGASSDALGLTLFPITLPVGDTYNGAVVSLPSDPAKLDQVLNPPPVTMPNTVKISDLNNFMKAWSLYKKVGVPIPAAWVQVMAAVNQARYTCYHLQNVGLDEIYNHLSSDVQLKARSNALDFLLADVNLADGVFSGRPFTTRVIAGNIFGAKEDVITATPTVKLKNALLIVGGDLDVENISGTDGTLYVYGDLFIHGGNLSGGTGMGVVDCSRMLIWADNVILEQLGGEFKGLITARRAMYLNPTSSALTIRGALLAGGAPLDDNILSENGDILFWAGSDIPLILNNTKLIYDPTYTKELNRFGTASLRRMYEIP